MLTYALRGARKVVLSAVTGVAALSLALSGPPIASAAALSLPRVKMTLPRSIAPSPRFQLPGRCGYAGASNAYGCGSWIVLAIDDARKVEPVKGMPSSFHLSAFLKLSLPEQMFAIIDIERTARGLTPIAGLTDQLNFVASAGAKYERDPGLNLPIRLTGGGVATYYGSNWAGGTANPMGADYYWMYDDGPGSPNVSCPRAGEAGCWGHRENVLAAYNNRAYCPAGWPVYMVMGASEWTSHVAYNPSIAEITANDCGRLPTMYFTWTDVERLVFGS